MTTIVYMAVIYLWVNVAITLMYKLLETMFDIPRTIRVYISILIPATGLYLALKRVYDRNKEEVKYMVNNLKNTAKKQVSTLTDKALIQLINFLDYLRGSAR